VLIVDNRSRNNIAWHHDKGRNSFLKHKRVK